MALEQIIIKISQDSKALDSTINKLEKMGKVDAETAQKFKEAQAKRGAEIDRLSEKLNRLTIARAKAFDEKSIIGYDKAIAQVNSRIKVLGHETEKASKQTSLFGGAIGKLGSVAASFFGVFAAIRVIQNTINTIKDFEKAVDNLSAITGATGEQLEFLKKQAIDIGKTTTVSATQAVEAFKLMASAKPELLENSEALAAVTKEAIALSEASGLELPVAIERLGETLNAMELPASEAGRVVNVLAASSKLGAKEVPFLTEALTKFGGVAASAGISVEESAAAIELLGAKIPQAETVGTGLRNVILELQTAAQEQGREFEGLGGELDRLAPKIDDVVFLEKTFGKENILVAQTLIKQRDRLGELTEAVTDTNVAYEQQQINTDNLASASQRLGNTWESLVLTIDSGNGIISDSLKGLTNAVTGFLNQILEVENTDFEGAYGGLIGGVSKVGATLSALSGQTIPPVILAQANLQAAANKSGKSIVELNKEVERLVEKGHDKATVLQAMADRINALGKESAKSTESVNDMAKAISAVINAKTPDTIKAIKERISELQAELETTQIGSDKFKALTAEIKKLEAQLPKATKEAEKQKTALQLLQEAISNTQSEVQTAILEGKDYSKLLDDLGRMTARLESAQRRLNEELEKQKDIYGDLLPIQKRGLAEGSKAIDGSEQLKRSTKEGSEEIDIQGKEWEIWQGKMSNVSDALGAVGNATDSLGGIMSGFRERQLQDIDQVTRREEERLQQSLDNRLITEEEFENQKAALDKKSTKERNVILKKQAETEKALAITKAIIATAQAVVQSIAASPLSFGLPWSAVNAALGAAQVAAIIAQPIPQFAKGTEYLDDKKAPHGKDTILMWGNRGEAVINAESNAKYPGLAKAFNEGKIEHWSAPGGVLKPFEGDFAERLAKSIVLQNNYEDIIDALYKVRKGNTDNTQLMIEALRSYRPNLRSPNV